MFRCFVRRWINFLEALLYYWTKFLKITLSSLSLSFLTRKNMDWNWNRTRRKEEESILLFDYSESFFHGYPIFIARPRDRIKDARGKYIPSSPSSKLAKVAVLVFFFAPRRVVCRPLDMKRAMEARKLRTSPSLPPPLNACAIDFCTNSKGSGRTWKGWFSLPFSPSPWKGPDFHPPLSA